MEKDFDNSGINDGLCGVHTAAKYLDVSHHLVRSLYYKGHLPYVKIGRRVLFRLADLKAFVQSSRVEAKKPKPALEPLA